ncbi:MAG: O-antigen ligase family protein [Anaerolineae bacterium]|nr:O-antigen ligase family protein [Anaerolineae bacterium]
MNRRSRARGTACLAGFVLGLTLIALLWGVRRNILLQTASVFYPSLSGEAEWEGGWELSERGADPSEAGSLAGTDRVTIPFSGTDFALMVRRGDYRANFFVSVDGEPANCLPREERGAYLVLSSPDYESQVVTISVASGLSDGPHEAVLIADRGWDQWPLVGWRVSRTPDTTVYDWVLAGLGGIAFMCLAGAIWQRGKRQEASDRRQETGGEKQEARGKGQETGCKEQEARGGVYPASCILHPAALVAALVAAAALALSPWFVFKVVSGLLLAVLVFLRLDAGLALVALTAPFYLKPVALADRSFSLVEIVTLLCVASWGIRCVCRWWRARGRGQEARSKRQEAGIKRQVANGKERFLSCILRPASCSLHPISSLDLAALLFVLVAGASFFVAEYRHVALRELRVLILEPALFYLMLRTSRLDGEAIWRVIHFFVLGAVVVALLGLVQYAFSDVEAVRQALGDVIRAEGGFHRLRSVYGSPNSVGLYLGRVLPVLVAVALFGASRNRRVAYGLAAVPVGLALLLSFSKGALLTGVPLSLLALGVLAGGRWLWASAAAVVAGVVAAIPLLRMLMRVPRFASLFDPSQGTLFFRLHLWRSSWMMFRDHPLLGVGPDNFLYHYRGRYILPAAWEEPHLSQAHNVLLDYATRMGVLGVAVGVWFQVAFWRLALPLRRLKDPDCRALALGLMCSMVNFWAHGMVDASYFLIDLAFVFFLTLGVVQWLARSDTHGDEN